MPAMPAFAAADAGFRPLPNMLRYREQFMIYSLDPEALISSQQYSRDCSGSYRMYILLSSSPAHAVNSSSVTDHLSLPIVLLVSRQLQDPPRSHK